MTITMESKRDRACLIVHGPDKPGIVAAVSSLIARNGGNIISLDQYSDNPEGGDFFQRVVFHRQNLSGAMPEVEEDLDATLRPHGLQWRLSDQSVRKRMAILASKSDHCLLDLLWRHRRDELPVSIPMVIANHTNTAEDVRAFGVPFFHVPSSAPTSPMLRTGSSNCYEATSTSWCWRDTCRSSPMASWRGSACP